MSTGIARVRFVWSKVNSRRGRRGAFGACASLLAALGVAGGTAAPPDVDAFGRQVPGTVALAMSNDYKRSSSFTLAQASVATGLVAYLDGLGGAAGEQQVRFAIYADQAGAPGALVAQTSVGTVVAGAAAAWVSLPLPEPASLQAGDYHLAVLGGGTSGVARYSRAPLANGLHYGRDTFSDGAADPYGVSAADDWEVAVYAKLSPVVVAPASTEPPAIAGTPRVGETLTGSNGSWSGAPTAYSLQWRRCDAAGTSCADVSGATGSSYALAAADQGATIQLAVTAANAGGSATATSLPTAPVAAAAVPVPPPPPPTSSAALGRDVPGTALLPMSSDYKRSSRFTLGQAGVVSGLVAYLDGLGGASGTQQVRFAVYADQGGSPGALLAQTSAGSVAAGSPAAWLRLPLSDPLALAAGDYHLAVHGGASRSVARYSRAPRADGLRYGRDVFDDGAEDPYGLTKSDDWEVAVYAQLAQAGATVPSPTVTVTGVTVDSITLSWQAPAGVDVARYAVYRDGTLVGETTQRTYRVAGLACGRSYSLGVVAVTSSESRSAQAQVVASTASCPSQPAPPADGTPPTAPTGLTVTAARQDYLGFAWQASGDDTGVAGYRTTLDGSAAGTTTAPSQSFSGLACGRTYRFEVAAFDAAGNVSATAALAATTAACPAPSTGTVTCDRVAAPSGSDGAGGTVASPYQTLQRLVDALLPGQTGCLRAGRYTGVSFDLGGVTVRSYPGERATIVGTTQVRLTAVAVKLVDLVFEGTGGGNSVKVYAADVLIENSELTNLGKGNSCLMLGSSSYGVAARPIIRNNRFHDCGNEGDTLDHSIYASNVVDGKITGNVFWNSSGYAIQLYPNAQRTLFAHNTVDGGSPSARGGTLIGGDSSYSSAGNVVEANVIAFATTWGVRAGSDMGSGNVARGNCFWQNASGDVGSGIAASSNVVADPLFVDRARRDYRLKDGSPCGGKGA